MDNKKENNNVIHGFKVFNPDWTCRPCGPTGYNFKQYTCPGKFEEEGELDVCGHGMHFCQTAADCFNYYSFNSENKVAEVIAYGEVRTNGDKSCTDKLEIVREISWDEVLRIVNHGKDCKGYKNTGDRNTGNNNTGESNAGSCNAGDRNTGNNNTGDYNTGDYNTGNWNTGNYNVGVFNTGDCNTGDCNISNWNTGNCNIGIWNTGNYNTGSYNTGNYNIGKCNAGNCNTGDYNTGDWNKSSFNTGCFNTEEQKICLFNKPSNITYQEWLESTANHLLNQIPQNDVYWVYEKNMTDEEKSAHPTYKTTGGYLKILDKSGDKQLWWDDLPNEEKEIIKSIPNFDAEIFFQCTGIKVEELLK